MRFNPSSIAFIDFLQTRLAQALPGMQSHLKMAPLIGNIPYRTFTSKGNHKNSAVLLLIFPDNNGEINVVFTLRSDKLASHRGQISFPGGAAEQGETSEETALRKTFEEIGINKNNINIIGRLSNLYVPPSNSLIQPVVAFCSEVPVFLINSDEVREIIVLPLSNFFKEDYLIKEIWHIDNWDVEVPFWKVHTTPLWGATAMIFREFLDLYVEYNKANNL